ncbi:MAG: hypothetical protein WBM69_22315 [Desulfobacterales bacterium]
MFNTAEAIEGLSCNAPYIGQPGAGRIKAYNAVDAVGPCAGDLDNNGTVDSPGILPEK